MITRSGLRGLGALAAVALAAAPAGSAQPPIVNVAPPTPVPTAPLAVSASLTPAASFFGDPLTALITVNLDTTAVRPATLRIAPSFEPYVETSPPAVSEQRVGHELTELYRVPLLCTTDGCLPTDGTLALRLPPVVVTVKAGGRVLRAEAHFPAIVVASRLVKSDLAASTPPFRFPSAMPAPVYGVSPGLLAGILIALAALLVLGALALVGFELTTLLRRSAGRRGSTLTPLQAALAYTREAAGRPEATDRRKAIGLLAATLAAEGHPGLADSTDRVAWSETPPTPEGAETLADDVAARLGVEGP